MWKTINARRGLLLALCLLSALPVYAADLGSGFSGCQTSSVSNPCPATQPQINNTGVKGTDNSWGVFIQGSLTVTQGAEAEGKIFVGGSFNVNTGSTYNVGTVGVGAGVPPDTGQDYLTVGGNISTSAGTTIRIGDPIAGFIPAGNLLHKGSIGGAGSITVSGSTTNNASLNLNTYTSAFELLPRTGYCLANQTQSSNAVVEFNGFEVNFRSTDGANGTYIFNVNRDIDDNAGGQTTVKFVNIPLTSTVIINLTKSGTLAVRANNMIDRNGNSGFNFDPNFRSRILWQTTDASTILLEGGAQFEGSYLQTNATATNTTMGYPGHNGRFIARGNVTQNSVNSEFHNYPFNGALPASCGDVQPIAKRAETGSGLYKEFIAWLAWDQSWGRIPEGSNKIWAISLPGTSTTLDVSCGFSNFGSGSAAYAYRPGDWTGDRLDDLYGINGSGSSNTLINAIAGRRRNAVSPITDTFRLSCSSALSDGRAYQFSGMLVADAEANGVSESTSVTSNGDPWQITESLIGTGGNGDYTIRANSTLQNITMGLAAPGTVVAYSRNATQLDIALQTVGGTAVAVGIGVPVDTSDAPASYGNAVHLFQPVGSGGTVPTIDSDYYVFANNSATATPINLAVVTPDSPVGVLGTRIDTNASVLNGSSATDDDTNRESLVGDDEDALSTDVNGYAMLATALSTDLKTQNYSISVVCKPNGQTVAGWIDFDRSGAFDNDERTSTACSSGSANLTWVVSNDISAGDSYLRLRTAADNAELSSATGLARTGEVEDHRIKISAAPQADMSVTLSDGVSSYVPGSTLTYTLTARNNGPENAGSSTVSFSTPTGTTISGWTCVGSGGVSCPSANGTGSINQTYSGFIASGTATYTVQVAVNAGRTGNLVASASISTTSTDNTSPNNSASDTDTQGVVPTPDMTVSLSNGSTIYSPGANTVYSLVVGNIGSASGAPTVSFGTPAGTTITGWTCAGASGAVCPQASGSGAINQAWVSFPANGSANYVITVAVPVGRTGNLSASASVSASGDGNSANNSVTDTDTEGVATAPNFSVTINDGRVSYTPGGSHSYTITVLNGGNATGNVVVAFNPPGSSSISTWSCAASGGAACAAANGVGAISHSYNNFAVGGGLTYVATVAVPLAQTGNLVATVTATSATDLNTSNNTASDVDTQGVVLAPDFGLTLTDGVNTYSPGGSLTYSLVLSNSGTAAGSATLNFAAPGGSSIRQWTCVAAGGAACSAANGSGNLLNQAANAMPVSGSLTYTLTVDVPVTQTGNLNASASVSSASDSNSANNSATDSDTQGAGVAYDLTVTLSDHVNSYLPGGVLSYELIVVNNGAGAAPNVTVSFPTPSGTVISNWTCSASGGACPETSDAGPINALFGPLNAAGQIRYLISVSVPSVRVGDLIASASISSTGNESNSGNNTASDTDSQGVALVSDMVMALSDGSASYIAGTNTTYTMTVSNVGNTNATTVLINFAPPTGTTFSAWTCSATGGAACALANGSGGIAHLMANFPAGGQLIYQVTAAIPGGFVGNLDATANVTAVGPEDDTSNNVATDSDLAGAGLDVGISVTDNLPSYTPGITREYIAVVSNSGLITANNIVIDLVSPGSSVMSGWTCVGSAGGVCPAASGNVTTGLVPSLVVGGSLTFRANFAIAANAKGPQAIVVRVTTPGDVNAANDIATDVDKPEVAVSISDNGSGGDSRYSLTEVSAVVIRGEANGLVLGQTVSLQISDADGTTINTSAVVDANYQYATAPVNLRSLTPGTITITASLSDSDGQGPATATSTALYIIDSDNDGLPDQFEGNGDCDNDGITNALDRDADNDGLPDALEAGVSGQDSDSDGVDNYFDVDNTGGVDANNDGIDDARLPRDSDSDAVIDACDVDSDNDSLPDRFEGQRGTTVDLDLDGDQIENRFDVDVTGGADLNGDGVDDAVTMPNIDGDNLPDYRDPDSDSDGISDRAESGSTGVDSDSDGIDDAFDNYPFGTADANNDGVDDGAQIIDSDQDSVPDFRDLDSDNDTLSDAREGGLPDLNDDGLADTPYTPTDTPPDSDSDGTADFRDRDSDGDGTNDIVENNHAILDGDNDGDIDSSLDTDGDGEPDISDGDPDAFGLGRDTDDDGILDGLDGDDDGDCVSDIAEAIRDSDLDGVPDSRDRDSDNDGISDRIEGAAGNASASDDDNDGIDNSCDVNISGGVDANGDGVDDALSGVDTDSDGAIDAIDLDSDGDTLLDNIEAAVIVASGNDSDGDGIDNAFDADLNSGDSNADGISEAQVPNNDIDGDGLANFRDLDSDGDNIIDANEAQDFTGDGVIDAYQLPRPLQTGLKGAGSWSLWSVLLLMVIGFSRFNSCLICDLSSQRKLGSMSFKTWAPAFAGMTNVYLFRLLLLIALFFLTNQSALAHDLCVPQSRAAKAEKNTNAEGNEKSPAQSADEKVFEPCYFVGFTVGLSQLSPDENLSGWKVIDKNDAGYGGVFEYQFAEHWFADLSYIELGKAIVENRNPAISGKETVAYKMPALWAGYWLFEPQESLNLFAKVGVGWLRNSVSSSQVQWEQLEGLQKSFGVGAQWRMDEHFMLRAGIDSYDSDARYFYITGLWGFGGGEHQDRVVNTLPKPRAIPYEKPAYALEEKPKETKVERACRVLSGVIGNVNFATNSAELLPEARIVLEGLIGLIKELKATVTVHAHTDNIGSDSFNLELSGRRANSVREYLISAGVGKSQIRANGHGEAQPIAENVSPEGRARNRRVEMSTDAEVCK